MSSIDEKRVYADQTGTVTAYVAADLGVAAVSVSADIVGEFSLVERATARDVAATARGVAIATDDGVLLGDGETFEPASPDVDASVPDPDASTPGADTFVPDTDTSAPDDETTFGPATAVTGLDGDVVAADDDGRVARFDGEWSSLGTCSEVRALDGDLVAAADGVHRIVDDSLESAGLDDVRDVASAGVPRAATPDGLFSLGNGWMDAVEGDFRVVDAAVASTADDASATDDDATALAAHAATPDALYEYSGGDWNERDVPVEERVSGVAYGPGVVLAVTDAGTLLADAGDGFRHRALGLPGTRAVAVVVED